MVFVVLNTETLLSCAQQLERLTRNVERTIENFKRKKPH